MITIDAKHMAVDRSSGGEIANAESVDLLDNSAVIIRKDYFNGKEERVIQYYPGGIAVVRRR